MDNENIELSDSDDYGEYDRINLHDVNKHAPNKNDKNSVFAFDDDDEDEDDFETRRGFGDSKGGGEESDLDMASDLEEKEDYLPDDRAWGQKKKGFYNADFDKDYLGSYGAEDAEIAAMEEEEARKIQKRLLEQLSEADFSLADTVGITAPQSEQTTGAIQSNLSSLSKRQKLELFYKESPEFKNLVVDFEAKMTEIRERIVPVIDLIKNGLLKKSPAGDFMETKYRIMLNYCANIVFYILLKTKKIPVKNHPVLRRLFRYRQLLLQMQPVEEEIITPQVDGILQVFDTLSETVEPQSTRKLLNIIKKSSKNARKLTSDVVDEEVAADNYAKEGNLAADASSDDAMDEYMKLEDQNGDTKRAITYEMAKNKGLTPKRSKEQRNPRVKHRNKYRKSIIRRRGQVRTARTEIPVYGGEPTGIKIGLKKGRKFT